MADVAGPPPRPTTPADVTPRSDHTDRVVSGSVVIVWFRRDLRVADNGALSAAVEQAKAIDGSVLPLFVLDPVLGSSSGANRLAYLYDALRSLKASGVPLIVRLGDPSREVPAHCPRDCGAAAVYVAEDFSPFGRQSRRGRGTRPSRPPAPQFKRADSPYVITRRQSLRKGDGTPFKVFTPFKRVWEPMAVDGEVPVCRIDPHLVPWWRDTVSEEIPTASDRTRRRSCRRPIEEAAAAQRFATFVERHLDDYDEIRNEPGADATSRLSADLKFGVIHPRQLARRRLVEHRIGAEVFRSELCWAGVLCRRALASRPETARHGRFCPAMEHMRVDVRGGRRRTFRRVVRRANRVSVHRRRYASAPSRGVDAQPGSNGSCVVLGQGPASRLASWVPHGSWRTSSMATSLRINTGGSGRLEREPMPRRTFGCSIPVSQGKKFDADGTYVRRWVPELGGVRGQKWIHEPWLAPRSSASSLFSFDDWPPARSKRSGRRTPIRIVEPCRRTRRGVGSIRRGAWPRQ